MSYNKKSNKGRLNIMLKKKEFDVFYNEVEAYLKGLYEKYSSEINVEKTNTLKAETYISDAMYKELLKEYGCRASYYIGMYVDSMLNHGTDCYTATKNIALSMYYEPKETIDNNTFRFIDKGFWDVAKIVKQLNKLYNLGMNVDEIDNLMMYIPKIYKINNYSIRLLKDNKTVKIKVLKAR